MKFNVHFTITGPSGRVVEAPNTTNPVESADMRTVIAQLSQQLPTALGLEVIAVRIEKVSE